MKPNLMKDPVVIEISQELNCTPAQVLLSFNVQRGISVIPKTSKIERLDGNFSLVDLTKGHIEKLENLPIHKRYIEPKQWAGISVFDE